MSKQELTVSSTAKLQQTMIARLKDKIKQQDEEIKQLKHINQSLPARVYRLSELESLV